MSKNKLIVFEGIDGAGKATQVRLLAKRLRAQGRHVTVFTSPRYDSPTGKIVKDALHGSFGNFVGLSPYLSAVPYLLDFAASRDEVRRALAKGVVICDRYVPSTVAYHSAKLTAGRAQGFITLIEDIAFKRLGLPRPNQVIYLHVPVAAARHLMRAKKKDQHERDAAYQARVARTYAQLARRKNWRTVECVREGVLRSKSDIHADIVPLVARMLAR